MNNERFFKLLCLNFGERNARMNEKFVQEKQILKDLCILNSPANNMLLHTVVKMELVESSDIIVETAFSVVGTEYLIANFEQIRKACVSAFMERAAEIEEIFLQNVDHLVLESHNTELINPYMPLADFEFMQIVEINKKVSEAYQEHIDQHTFSFPPQERNSMLNRLFC